MRSFVAALALVVGLVGVGHADEQVEQLKLSSATVVDIGPLNAFAVSPDGSTLAGFGGDRAVIYRDGRRLGATERTDGYRGVGFGRIDSANSLKFRAIIRTDGRPITVVMTPPAYDYVPTALDELVGMSRNGKQVALKTKRGIALRSFDSAADLREFEVDELKSPRFPGEYRGIRDVAVTDDGRRAVARAGYYPHDNCFGEITEPSRLWVIDGKSIRLVLDESQENKVDFSARFHWEHLAMDAHGETAVVAGFHQSRDGVHSCLRVIPFASPGRSKLYTFGVDFIRSIDLAADGKSLAVVWRTDGHIFYTEAYRDKRRTTDEARDFVRVYAVDGLKPLAESPSPILAIRAAALTRDGKQLVVARDNGEVLAWPLKPVD